MNQELNGTNVRVRMGSSGVSIIGRRRNTQYELAFANDVQLGVATFEGKIRYKLERQVREHANCLVSVRVPQCSW